MTEHEIETGRAGTQGNRSYAKNAYMTVTGQDEYLGTLTTDEVLKQAQELVEATKLVFGSDKEEVVTDTDSMTGVEVRKVVTKDGDAVAARNGDGIGVTVHMKPDQLEPALVASEMYKFHNERLRSFMIEEK